MRRWILRVASTCNCAMSFCGIRSLFPSTSNLELVVSTEPPQSQNLANFLYTSPGAKFLLSCFFGNPALTLIANAISIAVMPRLEMSVFLLYSDFSRTSGLIQCGVPQVVYFLQYVSFSYADTPKSANLASPCLSSRMFPALMSRWILRVSCKYSRPFNAA